MSTTPNVILEGIVGSQAYGLATPESDVDRLGVYVAPTSDVLGLRGRTVTDHSVVTRNPDRTLHEVGKMLALALNGNPTIMELLWLGSWETCTAVGQQVVDLRRAVLSTGRVRDAYCGYAVQQASKLRRRSVEGKAGFAADLGRRTEKHGRHCFRLLLAGEQLLTTGDLQHDMSGRRQEIFEHGRLAVKDPERFHARFEEHRERFNRIDSVLPDKPDVDRVNATLVGIRRCFL